MTGRIGHVYNVIGIGIGPFNLSLAALADDVPEISALFLDQQPEFSWHPGLLLEGTVLQVPFLADLVTMVDPTNRWSFLNYLRAHDRLFPFFFSERSHVPRREYDHYCRWVAQALPSCRFGARVTTVDWNDIDETFTVTYVDTESREHHVVAARHIVSGIGTEPLVPEPFTGVLGDEVFHSAHYLYKRDRLSNVDDITVIGSGQSGAEVFLDLLRKQSEWGTRLRWLARTPAFAPMEYSKLGLEHFTPDYITYFRRLPPGTRERLIGQQWQLYKGVSEHTLGEIYDLLYERSIGGKRPQTDLAPNVAVTAAHRLARGYQLECRHVEQKRSFTVTTSCVVLATGYTPSRPDFLAPLGELIDYDEQGRYQIDGQYRVATDPRITGAFYVQNAEMHSHGVGAPDLTLGAWRAATILNSLCGREVQPVPGDVAFTSFGLPVPSDRNTEREEHRDREHAH